MRNSIDTIPFPRAATCLWLPNVLAVVETGCIREAARILDTTAHDVARSIHRVERELAVRVFESKNGRLTLTPIGAQLLSRVAERFREIAQGFGVPAPPATKPRTWRDEEAERRRLARRGSSDATLC